jgi:heparan-alpha-glucosaminide N-acetyltransferase
MKSFFSSLPQSRVNSIDILRALTMILMIFVNDLWSLKDIPAWLEHVERGVDGMGLADSVFPAFLFIVGLSMPFALEVRRQKGDTQGQLLLHVLTRGVALLIMGVFLVNGESINAAATGMPRIFYNTLCCLSFIVIWNLDSKGSDKTLGYVSKAIGFIALLILAYYYRGGKEPNIETFQPHWWGILGLIGWAYLASGLITVLAKNNFYIILGAWVLFAVLSMASHAHLLPKSLSFIPDAIRGGTLTGLTMGGVLTAYVFQYFRNKQDNKNLTLVLLGISALWIVLSIITRPYWGLAKLGATPAWLFLCSAFTLLTFIGVYWLVDVYGKEKWFSIIRPAGTDTLLCYLIPYFAYATTRSLSIHIPEAIRIGTIGLIKSLLFAIVCAAITKLLVKSGVRLKL